MTTTPSERRRSRRRPILASFSLFVVVPKKGMHRLTVHDVSDQGLGFDLDTDGESHADFPVQPGEALDVHFYLNQSLFLPLSLKVIRVENKGTVRRVGAQLEGSSSPGHQAYLAFIHMLDAVVDAAQLAQPARE